MIVNELSMNLKFAIKLVYNQQEGIIAHERNAAWMNDSIVIYSHSSRFLQLKVLNL